MDLFLRLYIGQSSFAIQDAYFHLSADDIDLCLRRGSKEEGTQLESDIRNAFSWP